jgi:ubiquinone/menaquinone biosynthesis C-methylase UbiE
LPPVRPSLNFVIKEIVRFIEARKGPVPRILEMGCGIQSVLGRNLRNDSRAIILHGLDVDEYALANKEVDKVFIANAEKLPFEDNSYDVVFSLFMLEHIHDYQSALTEMARIVSPGGMVILIFPNPASPEAVVTRMTPYKVHELFRRSIQKQKDAEKHTFPTTFSFRSCSNVKKQLMAKGDMTAAVYYFAETAYRFRFWRTLGNLARLYTKILSVLGMDSLMSTAVVIGSKKL